MTDFLHLPFGGSPQTSRKGGGGEYLAEKEANAFARAVTTANNEM